MIIENNEILLWMFMRNLNIKLYELKLSSCFMLWTIQVKNINYHINIMIWILIKCFFLRYKIYDINIGISWLHMTYYTLSINYYFDVKESSLKLYFIFYIIFFSFLGSWSFGYFLLHQLGGSYLRPGKILPPSNFFLLFLKCIKQYLETTYVWYIFCHFAFQLFNNIQNFVFIFSTYVLYIYE